MLLSRRLMQSLAAITLLNNLAGCLATPLDDTLSELEASNRKRPREHIHVHESVKHRRKAMSSLAQLGAETSQGRCIKTYVAR